jgi:carboxylesterase type B
MRILLFLSSLTMYHHKSPFFISCLTLAAAAIAQTTGPTVTTADGPVVGRANRSPGSRVAVDQFLGISFAQPPINDLRFAPPRRPEPWTDPRNSTDQPPACIQFFGRPGPSTDLAQLLYNDPPIGEDSEDCLYLNVYVPNGGEDDKPVLYWIHGGSGIIGGVSLPLYDGTDFAANQDTIVVTSNYRLGCQ